jgi:hypothetical protein
VPETDAEALVWFKEKFASVSPVIELRTGGTTEGIVVAAKLNEAIPGKVEGTPTRVGGPATEVNESCELPNLNSEVAAEADESEAPMRTGLVELERVGVMAQKNR